jgi:hypothetical protein
MPPVVRPGLRSFAVALALLSFEARSADFLPTLSAEAERARSASPAGSRPSVQQIAYHVWYLPGTANTSGQFGAYFKTRTTILNMTATASTITATLCGPGGKVADREIVVPSGQAVTYQNFLDDVFSYSGAGGVILQEKTGSKDFIVSSEVYVDGPNGRYSTPGGALSVSDWVMPGETMPSYSAGVFVTSRGRANAACMNAFELLPSEVNVGVYSAEGILQGTIVLSIPGFGWAQKSIEFPVEGGVILWKANQPDQVCYVTNVDNTSNDGTLLRTDIWRP